jgi:hypothetical protein
MRLLALLVALAFASCDAVTPGFACTQEYVVLEVEVVDTLGRPVPGLTATSVNRRTGEPLVRNEAIYGEAQLPVGRYILATDSDAASLRVDGDPVRFTASGAGLTAVADYVLANDGCHIRVDEGPDRVVAR